MIRADAREPRLVAAGAAESIGDLLQKLVACQPAERVVDGPEELHVQREDRHLGPGPARCNQFLPYALEEKRAVREAGELVIVGKVVELLDLLDVFERKGDVAGQ